MHFLGFRFPATQIVGDGRFLFDLLIAPALSARKSTVQQGHGWSAVDGGDLWPAHKRKQTAARFQTPELSTRGLLWMPHSVLVKPLQRPLRTDPSAVGRLVHGMQPTDV